MDQHVVSDASFRCVIKANDFADSVEIHSAAPQAEMFVLEDVHDFSRYSQTHTVHLKPLLLQLERPVRELFLRRSEVLDNV